MKKFFAIFLSILCLYFASCGFTQEMSDNQNKENSNNSEQSAVNSESNNTDTTSEEPEQPTTRNATNKDLVLINFSRTGNNCVAEFLASDEIKECVLIFYLLAKENEA